MSSHEHRSGGAGQTASDWRSKASEMASEARERAMHGYEEFGGYVENHPGRSVAVGFGLGFGLGLLVGAALSEPVRSRFHHSESMAERLGNQLMETLTAAIPDRLARKFSG